MTSPRLPNLLAFLTAGLLSAPAPAADEGWIQLFNGKDLSGWFLPAPPQGFTTVRAEKKGGKTVALIGTQEKGGTDVVMWRVEDGLLVGGGPMTHLFHERGDFDDFHLKVVVKINDKGNSGIFFRSGVRLGVPRGFEAQVNATHGDPVKSGSLYPNGEFGMDKYRKENCVMNKAGHGPDEFFTEEVICEGPRIRILVNGKQTVDWTDPGNDPKRDFKRGHIAVQAHDPGSVMSFKSIEIKPLKK
ncbi:MAG: DUF1080 domain-containing protein [Gemmataceae bacterium]